MTQRERDLKADLIEMASERTEDALGCAVALLSAGFTAFGLAVDPAIAAVALRGVINEVTALARH